MLTQYWLARQCAISVPHSSMSAGEMGTAPLSLSSGDAAPTALSSSLAFTHRCTGAHAASSPSCSEGSWSLQGPCSARMPGSTLWAGRAMWTQAGQSCLYPVRVQHQ